MNDSERLNALTHKVADLERKLEFVMQKLNLQYTAAPLGTAQSAAVEWLRKGNKIEAIKAYREHTGLGLAEAKQAVDALEKQITRL